MLTYSTCADPKCPDPLLILSFAGQATHPTCNKTAEELQARAYIDAIQRDDLDEANRLERHIDKPVPQASLGSMALWYATVTRWKVFPLIPGEKRPATKNGFKDATRDPVQIAEWWGANESFNIGLPCGADQGFDCVDVDGPEGVRSLAELPEGALPDVHGRVSSPRGFHLFVLGTNDGNRVAVRPGIDYRSAGGFVVGAGSTVGGKRYTWTVKPSPQIYGKDSR